MHLRTSVGRRRSSACASALPCFPRPTALVSALSLALVALLAPAPTMAAGVAAAGECHATLDQRVDTATINLGESVGVRIALDPGCSTTNLPRHYMLVLAPWANAADAAVAGQLMQAFIDRLGSSRTAVGVVLGDQPDPRLVHVGFKRDEVKTALRTFAPTSNGAVLADMVRVAHNSYAAISHPDTGVSLLPAGRRHIVILGNRDLQLGRESRLRFDVDLDQEIAIELSQICVGGGCPLFDGIETVDVTDLPAAGQALADLDARPAATEIEWLRVRSTLGESVSYEFASANPAPDRLGRRFGSGFVEWGRRRPVTLNAMSYRVRPIGTGWIQAADIAEIQGVTSAGYPIQRFGSPPSTVQVLPRPAQPSACGLRAAAEAGPDPVALGASATVTLTLLADCPPATREVDVVLAIDRSSSMVEGRRLANVQTAARAFVENIDLGNARVAVVAFGSEVQELVGLTQDRTALLAAIESVTAEGHTAMAGGVRRAREILDARRPRALPVIVLLSDGVILDEPQPEADWANVAGIRVVAVCVNSQVQCEKEFRALAAPQSYFLSTTDPEILARFYGELGAYLGRTDFDQLSVTHAPFPVFDYEGVPAGQERPRVGGDGMLTWQRADPLLGRTQLVYTLEARGPGRWPVAADIRATWQDSDGGVGSASIPVPELVVVAPPDEGPCRPERLARAVSPQRVTVGEIVTSTVDIHLTCTGSPIPLEVVLVLDHSYSMRGQRLDDTRAAIDQLLAETNADEARFALVAFSNVIMAAVPLTTDREAIRARLGQLAPNGETNIGLAINTAANLLEDSRPDARRFIVLLTDGFNSVGAQSIPVAAGNAKELGIEIVAVCAGGVCDPALRTAVSQPSFYFDVPDSAGLAALFQRIASVLSATRPADVVVREQDGPALAPVPGSAVPAPMGGPNPDVWTFGFPGDAGVGIARAFTARRPGRHPVTLWAHVDYQTADGRMGALYVPPAEVRIEGEPPAVLPTALPLPTVTPTPSITPTAPSSPTAPSATVTRAPNERERRVVLPWVAVP